MLNWENMKNRSHGTEKDTNRGLNMIKRLLPSFILVTLFSVSGTLPAQDYDWHPALSDTFTASLGAMRSSDSFRIEANAPGDPGSDIDFGDSLGVDNRSTFFNGQLRWKLGHSKRLSLWGQYFSNDATGGASLTEDLEWDGGTFLAGTYAEAGVKLAVTRIFMSYSFVKNDRSDFGAGLGIHNLDISSYIEGQVLAQGGSTAVLRKQVSASQILPNIGAWYDFAPSQRWLLHGRVDWISANIGDYDGTLWNATAGINFQAWRHVGFDLSWQYFNLNVNVDKTDWNGGADMTYSGPVLSVTFGW
jgi:hypothetical protein